MFQHGTSVPYDKNKKIKDIVSDVKPDLLLCYRAKRMIHEDPVMDVPVVFIEQEYPLWRTPILTEAIQRHNTKAVILTGWFPEAEIMLGVPVYWMPFSANEEYFYTEEVNHTNRKKEVCFFGVASTARMSGICAYRVRRKAIQYLGCNGLMDREPPAPENKKNKWLLHQVNEYPKRLKSYYAALSCSFHMLGQIPLKSFEIMASGTALLTQALKPEIAYKLFGSNPPYFTYKNDVTNIVRVANHILDDNDHRIEVCKQALHLVNMRHLHKHRVLEPYEILQAVLEERRHKSQQFSYI